VQTAQREQQLRTVVWRLLSLLLLVQVGQEQKSFEKKKLPDVKYELSKPEAVPGATGGASQAAL